MMSVPGSYRDQIIIALQRLKELRSDAPGEDWIRVAMDAMADLQHGIGGPEGVAPWIQYGPVKPLYLNLAAHSYNEPDMFVQLAVDAELFTLLRRSFGWGGSFEDGVPPPHQLEHRLEWFPTTPLRGGWNYDDNIEDNLVGEPEFVTTQAVASVKVWAQRLAFVDSHVRVLFRRPGEGTDPTYETDEIPAEEICQRYLTHTRWAD